MALTPTGALYGVTVYGTEYYGAGSTSAATFRWGVEIDWDGDGVFDGSNEATRLLSYQCERGRKQWLQPNGQGFYPLSVGTFHLTLDNYDGRYDAWNTSSPLYPNVTYGRDVRIRVVDVATEISYNVFYGVIADIVPSGYGANSIVKITIEDGIRFLRNNYSYVYSSGIASQTTTALTEGIASDCGWLSRWGVDAATLGTNIPYYIADINKSAFDLINDLASPYVAHTYISASGVLKVKEIPENEVPTINEDVLLKDIGNPLPYVNSRNITRVYWSTYGATSTNILTYPSSTTSIQIPSTFVYKTSWVQSTAAADFTVNLIGPILEQKNKSPIVKIVNRPSYQFYELFDWVNVVIPSLEIDDQLAIGGISHYGTPQEMYTVYYFEPKFYS